MEFGIIGLGRMGGNLARQALAKGCRVVGYDPDIRVREELAGLGLEPAASLAELAAHLRPPRTALIYVPHGEPTDGVCRQLLTVFQPGDIVADGGNSHWEDSRRRYNLFAQRGIKFLDVGTSGGIPGARSGACFMVGGDQEAFADIRPVLRALAADDEAVFYAGPPGAGHFVKLVHNAIEFGMVQAIAEGVELLLASDYRLDLPGLFNNWVHGSVIRSWLVDLMGRALAQNSDLSPLSTYVEDTGEVKWVLAWALERDIPVPVTGTAQTALMQYRDVDSPAAKAVALLRNQYGGHPVHRRAGASG
ncbi:MAG: 6-phosphogluconate dehydrogenase (decarboxylating) [Chloroflexota bacterium]